MAKLSYKVSYYALYVMFAIILVVLGMFFFGGDAQGDAVLASVDAEMCANAKRRTISVDSIKCGNRLIQTH